MCLFQPPNIALNSVTTPSATTRRKRTPCVGICSTTYGDLVCRGCKRFAHEIVQWNGYESDQKEMIWQRLNSIRDEVALQWLRVEDPARYAEFLAHASLDPSAPEGEQLYECLRQLVVASKSLAAAGLICASTAQASEAQADLLGGEALKVMRQVDAEIYARSVAHYEHCFRIPV